MKYFDKLAFDGKFELIEILVVNGIISLDDLSGEAYSLFEAWIQS